METLLTLNCTTKLIYKYEMEQIKGANHGDLMREDFHEVFVS